MDFKNSYIQQIIKRCFISFCGRYLFFPFQNTLQDDLKMTKR